VDDNTVAFAQWGLGTMGPGGLGSLEELEELPDTVVSKKSRHSCTAGFPPSAGKTSGALGGRGWWELRVERKICLLPALQDVCV
jgi:hypothetical protein